MEIKPVEYKKEHQSYIRDYLSLPEDQQKAEFWSKDCKQLAEVKKHLKKHYVQVQQYTCPYCRQKIEVDHGVVWDAEHIVPKSKYPRFLFEPLNLCVVCKDCNQAKSDEDVLIPSKRGRKNFPCKSEDYIFVHPHFDNYEDHIRVIKEATLYIPINDKGRKTIELCGLLRFVYKFAEYGPVSTEYKVKIHELSNALLNANDPIIESGIMTIIQGLCEEGKRKAAEKVM